MVQLAFGKPFIWFISIYFFVAITKGEKIKSDVIDIPNQILPTPFNTFSNKSDLNGAESIGAENQPKSRRKRFVAFPEGSSFSVNSFYKKFN